MAPALKGRFFGKSTRILNIEILAFRDVRTESIEYHGLVILDTDSTIPSIIDRLKKRRLNGRNVLIRPYQHRNWSNDPRQRQIEADAGYIEKRKGDRRRGPYLEILKNVYDHVNTESEFYRQLNHQQYQLSLLAPLSCHATISECLHQFEPEQSTDSDTPIQHKITQFICQPQDDALLRLQFFASKHDMVSLLTILKSQLPESGLYYWMMPVIEHGPL